MTIKLLLLVMLSRWRLALSVLISAVMVAIIATAVIPKRYTASASVVLDVKSPDPIAGVLLPGMTVSSYMGTQIQVVASERVALRAATLAKLGEAPEVRAAWSKSKGNGTRYDEWLTTFLRDRLDVTPAKDSNVIDISYWAQDPNLAANVANAVVRAYIETTLDLRVEPARQYNSFFEEQAHHLRDALATAQRQLSDFQRTSGIITTDERYDSETTRLNDLTSQSVTMQAQASESNRRHGAAFPHANVTPEALANPILVALTSDLSTEDGHLSELTQRLGPSHPSVLQAKARIAQLRDSIEREQRRVAQSTGVAYEIDKARLTDLRRAIDKQRATLLDLSTYRDRLTVLKQDVENAQRAYNAVYARFNQSEMESQMTQTNVSILERAKPPRKPSAPRPLLNLAAGLVFGTIAAVIAVIAREFFDRRLRTPDDVTHGLGYPVLCVMPRAEGSARTTGLRVWALKRSAVAWGAT